MKVVYNNSFGGFHLSDEALKEWKRLKNIPEKEYVSAYSDILPRHDPILVQIVEEGKKDPSKYNTAFRELSIEELPDGTEYWINEYDGSESVETVDTIPWVTFH